MKISVNDTVQEITDGATVSELIEHLNLSGPVAVEINLQLCTRKNHTTTVLKEGDKLEVVTIVGGG